LSALPGEKAAGNAGEDAGDDGFRLLSIGAASTPTGCVARGWLVYRIAQGPNIITGYRRGDLQTVSADVAKIVTGLNERRLSTKGRTGPKPGYRAAAPPPPQAGAGERVHVGHLPPAATEATISSKLSAHGKVSAVKPTRTRAAVSVTRASKSRRPPKRSA
jgi:hypothetical protein